MECFFCVSPEEGLGEVTECSKCASVNHCEKHKEIHMPVTQVKLTTCFHEFSEYESTALFVTSKIEFSNSPILEFKRLPKAFEIKKQGLKYF